MYDFKNAVINKILLISACFIGFVILALILPGVNFILTLTFIWAALGLAGWGIGRSNGTIEDEPGVPFYKETKFYEYIARGPITLIKMLQ